MIFSATCTLGFAAVWQGAPEWLSVKVLSCGVAAVVLLVVALMLRGLQKVLIIAGVAALAAGIFFLARDVWHLRDGALPPEVVAQLDALAERTVRSPRAQQAWAGVQKEWAELERGVRERMAAGGEDSRRAIDGQLSKKEAALRAAGKKEAAEEVARLRRRAEGR